VSCNGTRPGLPELGLADQQAVAGHVGDRQLQGLPRFSSRWLRAGRSGVALGQRAQAVFGPKSKSCLDEVIDLLCRVDVRWTARLAGTEVIAGGELVPGVVNPNMAHEAADGFQPRVALCHGWPERSPIDGRLRVHMRLPAPGPRRRQSSSAGTPHSTSRKPVARRSCEISLDGRQHQSASGQG